MDLLNDQMRLRPAEVLKRMPAIYRAAAEKGVNPSVYLERHEDPTEEWGEDERLDSFGRVMKAAGIRTASDPARGYWCDTFAAFDASDSTRALIPEWAARRWREARTGVPQNPRASWQTQKRSIFTSGDEIVGSWARPFFDAAQERASQLTPDIALADITALQTPIEGDAYRAAYLTDPTPAEVAKRRITEGAPIPVAKITSGEHEIRLFKYGRGFEVTYEVLRRQRIDKVGFWIARAAIQDEDDKVAHALDVLINGDGNANAAEVIANSTLPDQVAGTLTFKGWLAFKLKWNRGYSLITMLANEGIILDTLLLNAGSANHPVTIYGELAAPFRPLNRRLQDGVTYGVTAETPVNKIVGLDTRFALEHATEIGSNISETERFVNRQTEAFYMTETEGFVVLDEKATRILDIAA